MKIIRLIFTCFLVILFSCSQNKDKKGSDMSENGDLIETGKDISLSNESSGAEDFDQFLERFSEVESFQLQRIKFPIKVVVPDMDHEGMAPIEENIGRYEWEQLDLTYDSTYLTRTYDQYYQVVRFKDDTAIVEIRGINNGIYADYYFSLIDKKWYLVTLYEASF